MPKMITWLWFDGQAEEAARYYVSVFRNARMVVMLVECGSRFQGLTREARVRLSYAAAGISKSTLILS